MSKFGLGRIQRGCLRVIEECVAAGKRPSMLNIASEVYRVTPDRLSYEQYAATRRALASLRQKGLVSGREVLQFALNGHRSALRVVCVRASQVPASQ